MKAGCFWGGCPLTPTRVDGSMSSNYETFLALHHGEPRR